MRDGKDALKLLFGVLIMSAGMFQKVTLGLIHLHMLTGGYPFGGLKIVGKR